MKKVKVKGLNSNEVREFEILEREELEKILDEIDESEIWKRTREVAEGYTFGGVAVTYLDSRNGEIDSYWIQQGNFLHPFDDFYRIPLCTMKTPVPEFSEDDLLSNEERYNFFDWQEQNDGDVEDYITEKWGEEAIQERKENALDVYAETFEPDWEKVFEQIDELYSTGLNQQG